MADDGAPDPARERTIEFSKTERGTSWRGLRLNDDGGLAIRGHDLGPMVLDLLDATEYEFVRTLTPVDDSAKPALVGAP